VNSPVVPAVLGRSARTALRRALPRSRVRLVACRAPGDLERVVRTRLTDAVVVDARAPGAIPALEHCRIAWPAVPRFVYTAFRPDDGELLRTCLGDAGAIPLVEGVDDAVLADLVLPRTASANSVWPGIQSTVKRYPSHSKDSPSLNRRSKRTPSIGFPSKSCP